MISTSKLCSFTVESPPTHMLGREETVQKKYDLFCKNKENGKRFINTVKNKLKHQEYYFVENDFPYYVESNVKHMICWYKSGTLKSILKKLRKYNKIITYWENLPQNKSIPDINHIHVFINN